MLNEISLLALSTSLLEVIAMLTGIAGVWLTIKENPLCFPVGIINVALYAWLFSTPGVRLYADALLQCVYILLLFYGWFKWTEKKKSKPVIHPSNADRKAILRLSVIFILSTILLSMFLEKYTDASFPWLDSLLTCASLCAQWMIAKKYMENWIIWIIVNIIYIPMYVIKHLPLTAILYLIFLALAVKGYREWKKNLQRA